MLRSQHTIFRPPNVIPMMHVKTFSMPFCCLQLLNVSPTPFTRVVVKGQDIATVSMNAGVSMFRLPPRSMGSQFPPLLLRTSADTSCKPVTALALTSHDHVIGKMRHRECMSCNTRVHTLHKAGVLPG